MSTTSSSTTPGSASDTASAAGPRSTAGGPLAGLRVIEMAAIGPVPFAGMMFADLGAEVIRVDRPGVPAALPGAAAQTVDVFGRGKRSIVVDLKHADGPSTVLRLIETADVLIEGLRPGVMERLGLGPDVCIGANERLVYGRMTGYGQDGPLAHEAGHDINYIALAGVLDRIGRAGQPPTPPLNLVGDFGGGAMFLITGVLAALHERTLSGHGQVVDAAMVDGAAMLTAGTFSNRYGKPTPRGTNMLDSGAPFYDAYETADGRYVAVGAIEPQFWQAFVSKLGPEAEKLDQNDREGWPEAKRVIADAFRRRTRDEWVEEFAGLDACVNPVLSPDELVHHPHHQARSSFVTVDGVVQPAPAPRFSRSSPGDVRGAPTNGADTDAVLGELGLGDADIAALRSSGAIA